MDNKELLAVILENAAKGKVVVATIGGVASMPLDDFISQPTDGLLYDLNRLPEVVMTFVEDESYGMKWVNDYAVYLVIKRLKEKLDAQKAPTP